MDSNSIHWGGYAGSRLVANPQDPLPPYILGGVDSADFLDSHLNQVSHPLVAGLGLLSNSTLNSSAWSVADVSNSSFHHEVNRLLFTSASPSLPPDVPQVTPRQITRTYSVRGVQVSEAGRDADADVIVASDKITRVSIFYLDLLSKVSLKVIRFKFDFSFNWFLWLASAFALIPSLASVLELLRT